MSIIQLRFIFPLAVVLAFLVPQAATKLQFLILPLLAIGLTLSVKDIHVSYPKKSEVAFSGWLIFINYVVLGGMYILFASILVDNPAHRAGLILLGIMPPAINIIPFSTIFKGNVKIAVLTEVIAYILALFITPIAAFMLFGESIGVWTIFSVIVILLLVPLLGGKLLHVYEQEKLKKKIPFAKEVIILVNGFIMYVLIGINRDAFFVHQQALLPILLVMLFVKFVFVYIMYKVVQRAERKKKIEYILFASFKNGGAATAIALMLFAPESTLPLAINSLFFMVLVILLDIVFRKNDIRKHVKLH